MINDMITWILWMKDIMALLIAWGMDLRNEDFVSGNLAEIIVWSIHAVSIMLCCDFGFLRHNGASRSTQLIVANILRSS